ncbi:hypothetical protein [Streptomyces sp. NPDC050535]|uniref:DUF4760 domain-containing protein n=1 Tax=Streptomyces sp. NPDC050535 TaxID=3365626 RepID=UPI0037B8D1F7
MFFNILTLVVALVAVTIAAASALRQASDTRRTNLLLFTAELGSRTRTPEFKQAAVFITTGLEGYDPALGISGLPSPEREQVMLVGGFYQDLGTLVVTRVLEEDIAIVMHYTGIKTVWRALEPFIRAERRRLEERQAGGLWGSFEHLAVHAESKSYEAMRAEINRKFPRRRFPTPQD